MAVKYIFIYVSISVFVFDILWYLYYCLLRVILLSGYETF